MRPWGLVGTPGPWHGPQGAVRDPRMTAGPWRAGGDPRVTVGPQGAGRTLVRWQGPQKAGGTRGSCWGPRGASGNPTKPAGTVGSCRGPRGAGGTPGNPVPLQLPVPPPVSPSTIVVEPGCTASLTRFGDVCIAVGSGSPRPVGPQLDAVQLSIFSHRFMSIAGGGGCPPALPGAGGRGGWGLPRIGDGTRGALWGRDPLVRVSHVPPPPCRADGPDPAADGHLHQHQGAAGLLLRTLRAGRGAGVQCPPHPCPPGCHAGDCPVPGRRVPGDLPCSGTPSHPGTRSALPGAAADPQPG